MNIFVNVFVNEYVYLFFTIMIVTYTLSMNHVYTYTDSIAFTFV